MWNRFWTLPVWARASLLASWAVVAVLGIVVVSVLARMNSGSEPSTARAQPTRTTRPTVLDPTPTVVALEPTATARPLPDRRDCDEMRGTDYRSPNEREWFLANCVAPDQVMTGDGQANGSTDGQPPNAVAEPPADDSSAQPPAPPPTTTPKPPVYSALQCRGAATEAITAVHAMAFGSGTLLDLRRAAMRAAAICLDSPLVDCGHVLEEGGIVEFGRTGKWALRVQEVCEVR